MISSIPLEGFFGYESFIETFNIQINFVDFYSLIHSIPRKWKDCLQERLDRSHVPLKINALESLLKMSKVCRQSYTLMLNKSDIQRSHEAKWRNILQDHVTEMPWHRYYSINFNALLTVE